LLSLLFATMVAETLIKKPITMEKNAINPLSWKSFSKKL